MVWDAKMQMWRHCNGKYYTRDVKRVNCNSNVYNTLNFVKFLLDARGLFTRIRDALLVMG